VTALNASSSLERLLISLEDRELRAGIDLGDPFYQCKFNKQVDERLGTSSQEDNPTTTFAIPVDLAFAHLAIEQLVTSLDNELAKMCRPDNETTADFLRNGMHLTSSDYESQDYKTAWRDCGIGDDAWPPM